MSDKTDPGFDAGGYPEEIGNLMLTQCAVSGCHNEISAQAAAGLDLSTWDRLFEGTRNNAAVVPFRPDQSFLMFFVNSDPDFGPALTPNMPLNGAPLSRNVVATIRDWILQGAPNDRGEVKFSGDPQREKVYICNQGCDLVTVIDRETRLIMRYVDVGASPDIESPHMVRVAPDGRFWYTCFIAGNVFQQFSTETDELVGEVNIGEGSWNTFAITADSKIAFVVDLSFTGKVAVVDLESMTLLTTYQGSGLLNSPHGSTLHPTEPILYVTAQIGNFIYKIDYTDIQAPDIEELSLVPGQSPNTVSSLDPHEVAVSPDGSRYFVTCQGSNEVRVFNTTTDALEAAIPVGGFPQEMAFSTSQPHLFVTNMEDDVSFPGTVGTVSVIDYESLTEVTRLAPGFQPHGIAVDDRSRVVYVVNRNASLGGPAPHHTTDCGGRNGFLTLIDMNTLELDPDYKAELSVDPYNVDIRFQ